MDLPHAALLAVIQGITEFLPISSSAHLILPSMLLGWPDQGLAFDTAVHLGSLLAVIAYFRQELLKLGTAFGDHLMRGSRTVDSRFAINLLIASTPIIPIGFFARFAIESYLRTVEVIAIATIVFAIALLVADKLNRRQTTVLNPGTALLIGLAQCLALIPGTSRSGITITAALLIGFSREQSARISFLIAIPAISGAALIKLFDLIQAAQEPAWEALAVGITISAVAAYLCIALFLAFIARIGFLPFVIYRLVLGTILLLLVA